MLNKIDKKEISLRSASHSKIEIDDLKTKEKQASLSRNCANSHRVATLGGSPPRHVNPEHVKTLLPE